MTEKKHEIREDVIPSLVSSAYVKAPFDIAKSELEKEYGRPQKPVEENMQTEQLGATESSRRKLLQLIGRSEEITYDQLVKEAGIEIQEVDSVIKELIMEGEIYMPKPGVIRII